MAGVEYLTHVGQMPRHAYFLFAAVKIRGGHGGHGRDRNVLIPELSQESVPGRTARREAP